MQKVDDLFSRSPQNTGRIIKLTTPTLQKRPLYNCLQVLVLHTPAATKTLGKAQGWGAPCPNIKLRLPVDFSSYCNLFVYLKRPLQSRSSIGHRGGYKT